MAKRKESDYIKMCLFCENATVLKSDTNLLCKYKGIVSEDFFCRKFVYDPLKREPKPTPILPTIDKEDLL